MVNEILDKKKPAPKGRDPFSEDRGGMIYKLVLKPKFVNSLL